MAKSLGIANYYLGVVVAVTPDDDDRIKNDKEWHEIIIDIPGVIQGVTAYPFRDELDEPKINDKVLVLDVDPLYHSYFLYRKLKEDGFIGFRSSGKMVSITPDEIVIGVFGPDDNDEYPEYAEDEIPDCDPGKDGSGSGMAYVKLDKSGNIEIKALGQSTITILGKKDVNGNDDNEQDSVISTINIKKAAEVNIESNSTVNIKKDSNINVDGNTTLTCKGNVDIIGSSDSKMADEPVPFGNELVHQLKALQHGLTELATGVNNAISNSVPAPMDGGATLKTTMLANWLPSYIKLQVPGVPGKAADNMWQFTDQMLLNKNVTTGGQATKGG